MRNRFSVLFKAGIIAAASFIAIPSQAADERAKRDINGVFTEIGVSETNGEIRKIKTTSDGFLLMRSTQAEGASMGKVDQGSAGTAEWKVVTASGTSNMDVTGSTVNVQNNAAAPLRVDPTGTTTQPISAASLPLPAGAATEATLSSIDGKDFATETTLSTLGTEASAVAITTNAAAIKARADLLGTEATLSSLEGKDFATQTTLATLGTESTLSTIQGDTTSLDGKVPAQGQAGMAASVPVVISSDQSGVPVTDNSGSLTVDAVSLPLPTGAATGAKQDTGNASLSTIEGDTTSLDSKIPAQGAALTSASLPVNIASDQTVPISAASLPLPTGAATSARQDTGNTSLSNIDGKLASLGQKNAAGSVPVVIASDQSAVTVSATDLDIRDLTSGSDSVAAVQSGNWSVTATAGAWDTPVQSTGTCASVSATVAISADADAQGTVFCNEGADPVRIGDSVVSSTIGLRVFGDQCVTLDSPGRAFVGALYCTSTTGSGMAFSALQAN